MITSIMLYASVVYSGGVSMVKIRRKLSSVYCLSAIKVIRGFRAVFVTVIPIDILADELSRTYCRPLVVPGCIKYIRAKERQTFKCKWRTR